MDKKNWKTIGDLWWAFVQLLVIWFTSNAPLFAAVLVARVTYEGEIAARPSVLELLQKNLSGGEVFIYSAALVAPFWWTLYQYHRQKQQLPGAWVPAILALISMIFGALIYGIFKVGRITDLSTVNSLGVLIYVASLVVWYWSLFGDRRLPFVQDPYAAEQNDVSEILQRMARNGK